MKKLINLQSVHCPDCNTKQKWFRLPGSMRELLWGGWTCPNCKCEMDRFGAKLSNNKK